MVATEYYTVTKKKKWSEVWCNYEKIKKYFYYVGENYLNRFKLIFMRRRW